MDSPTRAAAPSALGRVTALTTGARRAVLRRRRPLAALLLGIAAGASLLVLAPPRSTTVAVTVAARDLPAGAELVAADLAAIDLPPGSVPDHAIDAPAGEVLAAPIRRGEPITDAGIVGPGLTAGTPGQVAVPVRLSDADQAALLAAGDRIDLFATAPSDDSGGTRMIASNAVVLAVPPAQTAGSVIGGRLIVVGVGASGVTSVTAASVAGFVTFAWADG